MWLCQFQHATLLAEIVAASTGGKNRLSWLLRLTCVLMNDSTMTLMAKFTSVCVTRSRKCMRA
jgi:hypothetical protein